MDVLKTANDAELAHRFLVRPTDLHPLPAGDITFMFTDMESSTGLWEIDPIGMRQALAVHDRAIVRAVVDHGGQVIKHLGDGYSTVFESPIQAIWAATRARAALDEASWPCSGAVAVRFGLHAGWATPTGSDYFGPTINRAARISAVTEPGQIWCSSSVAESAVDASSRVVGLGRRLLRGIGDIDLYRIESRS